MNMAVLDDGSHTSSEGLRRNDADNELLSVSQCLTDIVMNIILYIPIYTYLNRSCI